MEYELNTEPISPGGTRPELPMIIAGPCSAESEEQVLTTATSLAAHGIRIFRAGIWKPRTRPGAFEGVGTAGLPWLRSVKRETGMAVAIEVATAFHVYEALKYDIDILWVGARTTANPFAVQEVADALRGVEIPILVKNPVNPDFDLWVGAFERLNRAGIKQLGAVHRGFSSLNGSIYRNQPLWEIPLRFRSMFPGIPMINDPSHISGKRDLVFEVARKALSLGFDGLMIESHFDPDNALSDKDQQVKPGDLVPRLKDIMSEMVNRPRAEQAEELDELRRRIDSCDYDLLVTLINRMEVSEKIGKYKMGQNIPVVQVNRWNELLKSRLNEGKGFGLSEEFVSGLFNFIHSESVNRQKNSTDKK
ncbi:MAG: bifunctional 3-deoxy-7-phosphoheptulonate synthase/chorismate mutase type II [Bacteroidales bacterium]|jgi:chorismate mutase|nr:bifunctional 3-deoxy-7-phosphoheptulonate synthase/chorismate mutase type II [Bacteroidales bacterium]